jgi:hypothetical protein
MKKVFTKYLVFVFLIPILTLFIFYFSGQELKQVLIA